MAIFKCLNSLKINRYSNGYQKKFLHYKVECISNSSSVIHYNKFTLVLFKKEK